MVMPTTELQEPEIVSEDMVVESFGYKPELKRSFTFFGMVGFAFSVLTTWTALGGSLVVGILAGGPPVIIYSWIGVCLGSMAVAYCFAEICSANPIAGGQYSWVAVLTPPKYARIASYVCGWFLVIGFLSAGAANGFIGANFVLGIAQLAHPNFTIERWHTCLLAYLVLSLAASVNIFGRHLLDRMGRVMIIFNLVSFVVVVITILAADGHKQSGDFVFKDFQNFTGFGDAYASLIGILQAAFGMTGYDAASHMTEELQDARKVAPKAIVMSVWIGAFTGIVFLIAAMFCIGNINDAATTPTGVPLIQILYDATGSIAGACVLSSLITIIALVSLCFLFAQSSRVVWAFARDRGLPFSGIISHVDKKRHVPVFAILAVLLVNVALMSIYFGSVTGFNTILAYSTEAFYLSYIMPLLMRLLGRLRGQKNLPGGVYQLGSVGLLLNILSILYLSFCVITFNFPSTHPVDSSNMNYTSAAFGVAVLIAVVTWFTTGRKHYTGPQVGTVLRERAESIRATVGEEEAAKVSKDLGVRVADQ